MIWAFFQIVGRVHLSFQFLSRVTNATNKIIDESPLFYISKIFEKLLFKIIISYLSQFIIDEQHDEMKGSSMITTLVSFNEYVTSVFSRNRNIAVYLNGVKAFHKVSHSLLKNKLKQTLVDH